MNRHLSSEERRSQIIMAALELLASEPIERLTTRQVAKRIGISQPALLRHFRSRDAILEAAIEQTRSRIEALAEEVLQLQDRPLAALQRLAHGILAQVEQSPGLPRILCHEVALEEDGSFPSALLQLVSMQKALVGELVRQAQARGEFPQTVDPRRAGDLFQALVQGLLLQWQISARNTSLEAAARDLFAFFAAGLRGGEPQDHDPPCESDPVTRVPLPPLAALDVRPLLAAGNDPLETVLGTLEALPKNGVLVLTVPFRPGPLITLLEGRAYQLSSDSLAAGVWSVTIRSRAGPEIVDLRTLPAPLPLERVLETTAALEPGEAYLARVPRYPRLLLPHLRERGLEWLVHEEPDGSALLRIERAR